MDSKKEYVGTLDESFELINFIVEGLKRGEQIPQSFQWVGSHFPFCWLLKSFVDPKNDTEIIF